MTADEEKSKAEVQLGVMQNEVFRIGAMMNALPSTYVTRVEYIPWKDSVEKRFDDVHKEFDDIDRLKAEGGKWAMEERTRTQGQIQETERHLQERLEKNITQVEAMHEKLLEKLDQKIQQQDAKHDDNRKDNWSWRQTWLMTGFMALITVLGYVINYLTTHPHP